MSPRGETEPDDWAGHRVAGPLYTVAIDTGGRALFNTNDMDGSIKDALAETSKYYLLACARRLKEAIGFLSSRSGAREGSSRVDRADAKRVLPCEC